MANERTRLYGDSPSTDTQGELSPVKFMAIGLLLAGRPFADVAREVGIDATTLYAWREEPAFALELRSQFALMREATLYGLFSLAADSIAALRTALKSPAEMARVAAAQTVLDRLGIRDEPQLTEDPSASTERAIRDPELENCFSKSVLNEFRALDDNELLARMRALLASKR
jgi:hypothetical protein